MPKPAAPRKRPTRSVYRKGVVRALPGTVFITRQVHFNSAHRLYNPTKSLAWNRQQFGACHETHGHNYVLEVTVGGEIDPVTGYVVDLGELKRIMNATVADLCDHRSLNDGVGFLRGIIPSTENLVIAFWAQIAPQLKVGRLHCVRLYETPRNYAEFFRPDAPDPFPAVSVTRGPTNQKRPASMKQMYLHRSESGQPPLIKRAYDKKFRTTAAYRASMPDMMEVAHEAIQGAHVPIQQVGIHNFKLPLKYRTKAGKTLVLETSVTGTVSLEAELKGINMSCIMRSFYEHKDEVTTGEWMGKILKSYLRDVDSKDARLKIAFSYPMVRESLRSGLTGYQFYQVAFEGVMTRDGRYRRFIHFDFVYSSACPCSAELSEHARDKRGAYTVPHSQRSKARVTLEEADGKKIWIEDVHALCLRALQTETQVMVKREDEQAFAELNGAYLKFVEDAARLLYKEFDAEKRIKDFRIACSHLESLHSHDAVSVICKGVKGGFTADFMDFGSLVC